MSKQKAATAMAALFDQPMEVEALLSAINSYRSYPGTQQNLYSYSKLAWNNYLGKLPQFTNYSGKYTQELGDDALAYIQVVELMPSYETLKAGHVVARNDLIKTTQPLQEGWLKLKGYINAAFSPENISAMLDAAGAGYYETIAKKSWDGVETFIRMANKFMVDYSAALLANNNMPAGFPTTFANHGAAFSAQRLVFLLKEKTARDGIKAKALANEAIYASLSPMTKTGMVIFRTQPEERRNFTISSLLKEVRGNSPSGIKGVVTTGSLPAVPVANALVYDRQDPTRFAMTGPDGSYELRVPSGNALLRLEAEGFVMQDFERKISVGTVHRQSFSMVPVPVAASSNGSAHNGNMDLLSPA